MINDTLFEDILESCREDYMEEDGAVDFMEFAKEWWQDQYPLFVNVIRASGYRQYSVCLHREVEQMAWVEVDGFGPSDAEQKAILMAEAEIYHAFGNLDWEDRNLMNAYVDRDVQTKAVKNDD